MLPDWPFVKKHVIIISYFFWRNSTGFLLKNAFFFLNWQLCHSGTLMALYHHTSPSVCPHAQHSRPLDSSCQKRLTVTCVNSKVLVHYLSGTRLQLFGICCHWIPTTPCLCHLLQLDLKLTSLASPFCNNYPYVCPPLRKANLYVVDKESRIAEWVRFFCFVFSNIWVWMCVCIIFVH